MPEEMEALLNDMLSGAFNQGMAMQRMNDAQSDFDSHLETVGAALIKFRELINAGPEKETVQ